MSAPTRFDETSTGEFDRAGVSEYLKTAGHIALFRELVVGSSIRSYLPVNKQAALARHPDVFTKGQSLLGERGRLRTHGF